MDVGEGIVLTTDRQSYAPAQPVRLTLRNETGEALGINLCLSTLEVRQGAQWARSPVQSDDVCTTELRLLEAGGSQSETLTLPANLPAGEYRFSTDVERMQDGSRGPRASTPFRVG